MSWQGAPSQDVSGGSLHRAPLSPLGKLGKLVNVVIGNAPVFTSTLALPLCIQSFHYYSLAGWS